MEIIKGEENQIGDTQTIQYTDTIKSIIIETLGGVGGKKDGHEYGLSGSCNLVTITREGYSQKILIDFGMHQGSNSDNKNQKLPFEPSEINAVLLTHAHIDHSGRLPMLIKGDQPFRGKIYMHHITQQITKIMLLDCAKLMLSKYAEQIEQAQNKKRILLEKLKAFHKLKNKKNSQTQVGNDGNLFEYDIDPNELYISNGKTNKLKKPSGKRQKDDDQKEDYKSKKIREKRETDYLDYIESTTNLVEIGFDEKNLGHTKLYDHLHNMVNFLYEKMDYIQNTINKIENNQNKLETSNISKHKKDRIRIKLESMIENLKSVYEDILFLKDFFVEKSNEYNGVGIKEMFQRIEKIVLEIENQKGTYQYLQEIHKQLENITNLFEILKYDFCTSEILEDEIEKLQLQLSRENGLNVMDIRKTLNEKKHSSKKLLYHADDVNKLFTNEYMYNGELIYNQKIEILPGVYMTLKPSGHIIGSSQIILDITDNDGNYKKLGFSGDLGKFENNILEIYPEIISDGLDFYMIESTYGDRNHTNHNNEIKRLIQTINEIYQERGKIIIPCFMLQRLQDIAITLFRLQDKGHNGLYIPNDIEIFTTGKNSKIINNIYFEYLYKQYGLLGKKGRLRTILQKNKGNSLDIFRISRKKTNIMLAPAGMVNGGPIMQYLYLLENPANAIFFVGYQAEGTLGRRILEGTNSIFLPGKGKIQINARVEQFKSFSSHAGQGDLIKIIEGLNFRKNGILAINHGEFTGGQRILSKELKSKGNIRHDVEIQTPHIGDKIILI